MPLYFFLREIINTNISKERRIWLEDGKMQISLKTEKVYTILELNNLVRHLIRTEFSDYIWVCGEIQDFKMRKDKKHIYFNLVQKHPEADEIIAKVRAIIFEDVKMYLFKKLQREDSSFELKDDIEVKVLCKVDLYPKWGEYTLYIFDIDPIYTLGKIAQNRYKILEDLKRRNLLERNKNIPFSHLPLNIGLITALDSAAYHDFVNELKSSHLGFKVYLYNCYMQGKFVERDVVSALDFFNSFSKEELDVIVITRGGGSIADLSWFDNKRIAEKIAFSKFPVISALGHQINVTITDLVTHTFLKTPTKAAQFLIEKVEEFLQTLDTLQQEILNHTATMISKKRLTLQSLAVRVNFGCRDYFKKQTQTIGEKKYLVYKTVDSFIILKRRELSSLIMKIDSLTRSSLRKDIENLSEKKAIILNRMFYILKLLEGKTRENLEFLIWHTERFFQNKKSNLKYLEDKINILDPKNILRRGYSITFKDSKVIKSANELKEEEEITTILFEGKVSSIVKKIKEKDE
ncbi:MAG: exodeoxyribonuclease VII large subunit [Candidatus Omnitrophica bacterium 4484_70.1]|nr:MAG: exodeoxyribonuclease VII large subunit [Candidatus Omnitrophica bacterium 4484_70.1]